MMGVGQIDCAGKPVPKVKNLDHLYERYSADRLGLTNTLSLDLGPGYSLRNPFHCNGVRGVDVRSDLERGISAADLVIEPIPFADNSFDFITAYDFLEHIPRVVYLPERRLPFVELMNEVHRVLKPQGIFFSHTPIYPYASVFRDPTHVNIMTVETFPLYFDDQYRWASIYGFRGAFKILEQVIKPPHLISLLQKV
jgi:SAM-dependent methyltransferase